MAGGLRLEAVAGFGEYRMGQADTRPQGPAIGQIASSSTSPP